MRELRAAGPVRRLRWAVEQAEPRVRSLAFGRTLLAAVPLATLLANPDSTLFSSSAEAPRCAGMRAMSLWCLIGPTDTGLLLSRILSVAVLVVVVSGYRPRWTCVPHWYIAFSLTVSASISDGGDRITQIAAMLLIPVCLGDGRRWQWSPPTAPLTPGWRGSAFAGLLVLRVQVAVIYATAVVTKLNDPLWHQGSAMYVVVHDPDYGFPAPVRTLLEPALSSFPAVAAATWSVIGVQAVLAFAILGGARLRRIVLALGIGLHLGIALLMNLPVFGMAMIGLLIIGTMAPNPSGRGGSAGAGRRDEPATTR
ncbi:sporulation-delaying protein SdpB family protein [Saccharothrix algeriensis]|uniref:Antimicrobial peptide system SdpB family protein n=1 Tax=Saccharothrix algeriensis TaxID=173560 RepID=A0ABS2S2L1_9PSEU|nr:sporulation-delaying protein SdpB family protein [Saccharothrix algeriensis]MBM7810472.1 antimicrobial peptide system SdpB family protein [Saccharothrix algeriensis]